MTTGADVKMLANRCRALFNLGALELPDEYRYANLGQCILDAVFSIGVRYASTQLVVQRYCAHRGIARFRPSEALPAIEEQEPLSAFIAYGESQGSQSFAQNILQNKQRTSTRGGILKADACGSRNLPKTDLPGRCRLKMDDAQIIARTCRWLERAVIGLNLCPFAQLPYRAGRVHFVVSHERSAAGLARDLEQALLDLHAADPRQRETTLLIHPWVLNDFAEYNLFLEVCDALVAQLRLEGELQVASFHPDYQFAGTTAQDVENCTNRSPFPTLHLLREQSVSLAVESTDTEQIYLNNIERLRELRHDGWDALWRDD